MKQAARQKFARSKYFYLLPVIGLCGRFKSQAFKMSLFQLAPRVSRFMARSCSRLVNTHTVGRRVRAIYTPHYRCPIIASPQKSLPRPTIYRQKNPPRLAAAGAGQIFTGKLSAGETFLGGDSKTFMGPPIF